MGGDNNHGNFMGFFEKIKGNNTDKGLGSFSEAVNTLALITIIINTYFLGWP